MFYALRLRLENTSEAWLREYLDRDGLDIMLNSLCEMAGRGFTSFSDAILQLDCVSCIRAILNTSIGLDFMVRHQGYTAKLILGAVSYTHLRAHETSLHLVCRLLLEKTAHRRTCGTTARAGARRASGGSWPQ